VSQAQPHASRPAPLNRWIVAAAFGVGDVVQAAATLGAIKPRAESAGNDRTNDSPAAAAFAANSGAIPAR